MVLLVATTVCRLLKNSFFWSGISVFLLSACQQAEKSVEDKLPFYNTAAFDAEWIDETDSLYPKIHRIAPFSLPNQVGHLVTNDSLSGQIYVANFFFSTCPSICPKMMTNLKTLQQTFGDSSQIKLVSFSVMPWVDSVARLKKYGELHGIRPGKWHLLTGNKDAIYTLGRTSFFAEKGLGLQKDSTEFMHTESMLLIDTKGRIRGIYNATQKPDIERITDDMYTLLKE